MAKVGSQFGYISQQREPRVMTGWGTIEKVEGERAFVRWPGDLKNPMWVSLRLGEVRG
jgi:hypothetical protein